MTDGCREICGGVSLRSSCIRTLSDVKNRDPDDGRAPDLRDQNLVQGDGFVPSSAAMEGLMAWKPVRRAFAIVNGRLDRCSEYQPEVRAAAWSQMCDGGPSCCGTSCWGGVTYLALIVDERSFPPPSISISSSSSNTSSTAVVMMSRTPEDRSARS